MVLSNGKAIPIGCFKRGIMCICMYKKANFLDDFLFLTQFGADSQLDEYFSNEWLPHKLDRGKTDGRNFIMKLQNPSESRFFLNRLMVNSREIEYMIPQRIDRVFVGHAVDIHFVWI